MTNNAKARMILGMDHWRSNTQKVTLFSPTYRRLERNSPVRHLAGWRVLRTKSSDHAYGSF
ncbi:hypothetical protein P4Y30_004443 [Salmonella enterica]|nr:hypothetical protein [Salmonella enterica]EKQ3116045.1 hypothetical protein [Salmonella enterica]